MLCFGCGPSNNIKTNSFSEVLPEPYVIDLTDIDNLPAKNVPLLSDVVDSLEYIKLETHPDYLIGSIIDNPVVSDKYLFLYCSHNTGLLQYSRSGKFIRKIGAYGKGPGEYLQLNGFWIDDDKGIIYTVPNWKTTIDRYDWATGKYIGETQITTLNDDNINLKGKVSTLYPFSGDTLFSSQNGVVSLINGIERVYNFVTVNIFSGQIIHAELSHCYQEQFNGIVMGSYTWKDNYERQNFLETPSDTIYIVNKDYTLSPRIILKRGNDIKNILNVKTGDDIGQYVLIQNVMESDRYIMFWMSYQDDYYDILFDKCTGEEYLINKVRRKDIEEVSYLWGLKNDIDGGFNYFRHNGYNYGNNMWFGIWDAYKMKEELTDKYFQTIRSTVQDPKQVEKLQRLVSILDHEDNPVLVIAHLKKLN